MEDGFCLLPWKTGLIVGIYPRIEKMKKSWIWEAPTVTSCIGRKSVQLIGETRGSYRGHGVKGQEGNTEMTVNTNRCLVFTAYIAHSGFAAARELDSLPLVWHMKLACSSSLSRTSHQAFLHFVHCVGSFASNSIAVWHPPCQWRCLMKHYMCWKSCFPNLLCLKLQNTSNITV